MILGMSYKSETLKARWAAYRGPAFWARVERRGPDECWPWIGSLTKHGYGSLGFAGKVTRAHRAAWILTNGDPGELHILHTCDNRKCCNPAHLYAGTHDDNVADMVQRRRRKGIGAGEKNGRAKLTQEQAENIRQIYALEQYSQEQIGEIFGVSQHAISKIVRNKRYAK